ncbi:hypothetical protein [Aquihabitans sp. McL0605]|uniref:hypothetical protein n=1 Tax=Aquihabitans sp. McL0605 TaxID=3415671 RepID=UPI003CF36935
MPGCYVTRRDLLRWTAFAAAAAPAGALTLPGRAWAGAGNDVTPTNLELVTLTEDEAIITWYTGTTGPTTGSAAWLPPPPTPPSSGAPTRRSSTAPPPAGAPTPPTTWSA